jgi:hypothetical protein
MNGGKLGPVKWVSDSEHFRSMKPLNLCAQTVYRESIFGMKVTAQLFNSHISVECLADEDGDIVLDEKYLNDKLTLRCEMHSPPQVALILNPLTGGWKKLDARFLEYSLEQILVQERY